MTRLLAGVVIGIVLAGLAGGAFALAGSSGGAGLAGYALVDPNGGSPQLVSAHTNGFLSVSVGPFGAGDYCLTAAPGVNVADTAAVASGEAFLSDIGGFVTVRYPTAGPTCGANQLEVKTFDQNLQLTDRIGFTVNVP